MITIEPEKSSIDILSYVRKKKHYVIMNRQTIILQMMIAQYLDIEGPREMNEKRLNWKGFSKRLKKKNQRKGLGKKKGNLNQVRK